MEEDIKILEEYKDNYLNIHEADREGIELGHAIENLIKAYKELKENSIPKSVIREKIEEYKNVGKCTTHNGLIGSNYKEWREYVMQDEIDILQEILEG